MKTPRGLATAALLWSYSVTACSGGTDPGPGLEDTPVAVDAPFVALTAVPGSVREIRARVTDALGNGVPNVQVTFTVAPGNGDFGSGSSQAATTNANGIATAGWALPFSPGQFAAQALATYGGSTLAGSPIDFSAVVESFTPPIDEALNSIGQHIASSLSSSRTSIRSNPGISTYIQAKIAMLETPNLASSIVADRLFEATTVRSSDGRDLDLISVFPLDTLRPGAQDVAATLSAALPVLEGFMDLPLQQPNLHNYYGFVLGSSGGGGRVFPEDRGTYQARVHLITAPPPYEALLTHELGHSYIGHESLTQFLELLLYNVVATGSTDISQWTFRRQYTGPSSANTGVRALMEIRELIGHDAMARAYRTLYLLRPPYGQLLTSAMKQAFVDQAPAALRAQVADKAEQIGY